MGKSLYISEKPSVAQEFAKALKVDLKKYDGYLEGEDTIITWCVGHLVTMSYPDKYDSSLKRWSMDTLPFLPDEFKYEVIPGVSKQFKTVSSLLNRNDVDVIYVCTDSGREGEYIYRLVDQEAKVPAEKEKRRVWIDSQTEEEILRGIKEAKLLNEYDRLSDSAYLRAKEDYLMGINFSRILTLKYSYIMSPLFNEKYIPISVGRVMTCVLGMIVKREREIREFVKTPFFKVIASFEKESIQFNSNWKVTPESKYFNHPKLYKDNGFTDKETATELIEYVKASCTEGIVESVEKKKEKKNPPLLFNLAELQNECSKLFKISPNDTLAVVQELYEKKLVTYPRTDARVLSSAVAKEIYKNIKGLCGVNYASELANEVLNGTAYKSLEKTRYVNDKQITDHYAIVPTGQGLGNLNKLSDLHIKVYEVIVRRFLAIFFPAAEFSKNQISIKCGTETFTAGMKVLLNEGYMKVMNYTFGNSKPSNEEKSQDEDEQSIEDMNKLSLVFKDLKKGDHVNLLDLTIKEGETTPPKRYNSGSMILAMENAGQLIEDEELRAQIKGSGIGTSATRAEILNKLVTKKYINLNKKTQVLTPTLMGELIHDVVFSSIRALLNPELTASWEKGLTMVSEGKITSDEYMKKLTDFVSKKTDIVKGVKNQYQIKDRYAYISQFYKK